MDFDVADQILNIYSAFVNGKKMGV